MAEAALETLRTAILAAFPELAAARFSLLTDGWESQAVDVDDRLIFRFPRFERGAEALRREARLLAAIGARLPLAVPRSRVHPGPPGFAWHVKLPGGTLLPARYDALPEAARQRLAENLAGFQAALHGLDHALLRQAGATPVWSWPAPEAILHQALPRLPAPLHGVARRIAADCAALPPDPAGTVFGHFDTHGWNLAFDHAAGRLQGVFDFGSSGFGPRHRDFLATSFIGADLTARMMSHYEALTGLRLDRDRVALLTGLQRLMEFGEATAAQIVQFDLLGNLRGWIRHLP